MERERRVWVCNHFGFSNIWHIGQGEERGDADIAVLKYDFLNRRKYRWARMSKIFIRPIFNQNKPVKLARDLTGRAWEEEKEWQRKRTKKGASGLAKTCAVPRFPANAGNEEIGSHQNMQALSSRAHLSKDHRQASVEFRRLTFSQMK